MKLCLQKYGRSEKREEKFGRMWCNVVMINYHLVSNIISDNHLRFEIIFLETLACCFFSKKKVFFTKENKTAFLAEKKKKSF